jgi:hypothetical protein
MARLALALAAAVGAGACNSYSSGAAVADMAEIAVGSVTDVALNDCELPRSRFRPTGAVGAPSLVPAGARFTRLAVYRGDPPRQPHAVTGVVRAHLGANSCSNADLVQEVVAVADARGCDAVVVGRQVPTAGGGASLDASCLAFHR